MPISWTSILLVIEWGGLSVVAMWFEYRVTGKLTFASIAYILLMGPILVLAVILAGILKLVFSKEFWNTPVITKK